MRRDSEMRVVGISVGSSVSNKVSIPLQQHEGSAECKGGEERDALWNNHA